VLPDPNCMRDKRLLVALLTGTYKPPFDSPIALDFSVICWIASRIAAPLEIVIYTRARFSMSTAHLSTAIDTVNQLQESSNWELSFAKIKGRCNWSNGTALLDVPGNGTPA
jgi:hypothetical protein